MNKKRGYAPVRGDVKMRIARPAGAIDPNKLIMVDPAWFLERKKKVIKTFTKIMRGK